MLYRYIYRRANGIYIYINIIPKKLQFAAYGQFVLVYVLSAACTLSVRHSSVFASKLAACSPSVWARTRSRCRRTPALWTPVHS